MQHRVEDEGQDSLYQEASVVPALHCLFFVNHIYKFVGIYCSDPGSQFNRHRHVTFPHHIFDGADELVVKQQMLRFILGVGSRVEHPTHTAGHCSKMLLSCILREQSKAISSLSILKNSISLSFPEWQNTERTQLMIHVFHCKSAGFKMRSEETISFTHNNCLGAIFVSLL